MKTPRAILPLALAAALCAAQGARAQQTQKQADTPPAEPAAVPAPAPAPKTAAAPAPVPADAERGLRLNFRGVPLEMVLNYLSDAAGFIIVLDTPVKGTVDVWSNQALNREEAVSLLNTVLNKNGYAAIRNGRTLRVVSLDQARTKDIPVHQGSKPDDIQKSDEMVTQILPVRYANAAQLVVNLRPLLQSYAELSANESGNALVLTATQSDVRRMAEIVTALDTSLSSVSGIKVFPLKYADAKEMATAIKELFAPPTTQDNNNRRNQFVNRFFGGGGPPGFGGFGGPGGGGGGVGGGAVGAGASAAIANNTRVIAVADERANALVVSAPDDFMPEIIKLVDEMDVQVSDVTELRVFHLKNADPLDIQDILAELFPDDTRSGNNNNNNNPGGFRFGGPGGFAGGGGGFRGGGRNNQTDQSQRAKKMGRVLAVADARTSSIIITAASELMPQIAMMIEQLDQNPARKQRVFVYSLENADVQQVEQIVRGMFERSYTSGNRNNNNQNSALSTRSQQTQTQPANGNSGFGGFGNGAGGGGGGGVGQFGR